MSDRSSGVVTCVATSLILWLGFFAGWTLVSIPLTLSGAPFWTLVFAGLGGFGGMVVGWLLRGSVVQMLCGPGLSEVILMPERSKKRLVLTALGCVGFAVGAAYFVKTSNAIPLWGVTLAVSIVSLFVSKNSACSVSAATKLGRDVPLAAGFFVLSLVIMAFYIVVLRPDADDAFYLNLPIGIKSASHGMMVADTMYGVGDWPLLGSNYRVEALPTLTAGLSWLTGLSVLSVAHGVLPLVWCLAYAATLFVIGYGFFGRSWWVFAGLALLAGWTMAGSSETWGVHGIFRFFHGKAPLLFVVGPLIVFIVIQSQRAKASLGSTLGLLMVIQIAAVGLTANAIYLMPLLTGLVLFVEVVMGRWEGGKRLLLLGSLWPPLVAGLYLIAFDRPVAAHPDGHAAIDNSLALWNMASSKDLLAVLLAVILSAALAGLVSSRGRWATAYLFGCLIFVFNPLIWPLYAAHITGGLNFRLFWAVPFPSFVAVLVTVLVMGRGRKVCVAAFVVALGLGFGPHGVFGVEGTSLSPSVHKVPVKAYDAVRYANEITPSGRLVLGVEEVSRWIPMMERHAATVYTRAIYLKQSLNVVDSEIIEPRQRLGDWVNGLLELGTEQVARMLGELGVGLVIVNELQENRALNFDAVMALVKAEHVKTISGYDFYVID